MGLQRGQLQSCALIQVGKFFLVANQIHSRFTPVTAELCPSRGSSFMLLLDSHTSQGGKGEFNGRKAQRG